MNVQDADDGMRGHFVDTVDIPDEWEYLNADQMERMFDMEFDAYSFAHENDEWLVVVNLAGLPESFEIMALQAGADSRDDALVAHETTHLSNDASDIASDLMRHGFE